MKNHKHTIARWMICISMLLVLAETSIPSQAHAQWATFDIPTEVTTAITTVEDTLNAVIQYWLELKYAVLDPLAWGLAKMLLQQMTASTVNWVNSGFKGSPAFLTNPAGYFANIGDQATGALIANSGALSSLCSPFSVDIRLALALGQAGGGGGGSGRYACTLSTIINNAQNFAKNPGQAVTVNGQSINGFMGGDFSQGGWPAFIALSEPQNNESGAYLQAHSDLLQQIGAKQSQTNQQLNQGKGFLSFQSCKDVSGTAGSAASGSGVNASGGSVDMSGYGGDTLPSDTGNTFTPPTNPWTAEVDQYQSTYNNMGCGGNNINSSSAGNIISTGGTAGTIVHPTNPWLSEIATQQSVLQSYGCANANGAPGPNAGSAACASPQNFLQQAQTNSANWIKYNANNNPAASECVEYNGDGSCAQKYTGNTANSGQTNNSSSGSTGPCQLVDPDTGECLDANSGSSASAKACATEQGLIDNAQAKSDAWDSYNEGNDPNISGCAEYNADGSCAQYAVSDTSNPVDNTSSDNIDNGGQIANIDNGAGSDGVNNGSDVSVDQATGNLQTCDTQTPGSVISDSLGQGLGSPTASLVAANSFDEVIGSLATQLLSQVLTSGLHSISQKGSGSSQSFINQMANQQNPALQSESQGLISSANKEIGPTTDYKSVLDQIVGVYADLQSYFTSIVTQCKSINNTSAAATVQSMSDGNVAPLLAQAQAKDDQAASNLAVLTNLQTAASSTDTTTLNKSAVQYGNMIQSGTLITALDVSNAKADLKAATKTAAGLRATGVPYQMTCVLGAATSTAGRTIFGIPIAPATPVVSPPAISGVNLSTGIITGTNFTYTTSVYAISTLTNIHTDLMFKAMNDTTLSVDFSYIPPGDNDIHVVNPTGTSSGYKVNIVQ